MAPDGLWIALTIWAGFAQTLRNAAQRSLVGSVGTLGATLVRFLFGLPFALAYFGIVLLIADAGIPAISWAFVGWVFEAGVSQIVATALLLRVMEARNFAIGVAYSKTELVQVAIFGAAFLGDPTTLPTIIAIFLATVAVLLLSPAVSDRGRLRGLLEGWTSTTALLGIASGAGFAIAAVGYRGAALELGDEVQFTVAAAYTLVWAMAIQVFVLGGWLLVRNASVILHLLRLWRQSLLAGFMGAAASAGWFTAFAIETAAHVRTLGLVELLFSLAIARRFFRESLTRAEMTGVSLLTLALIIVTLAG